MRAVELIRKKRDGGEHTREELAWLIQNYTQAAFPDYQMAAWLMAALLRGLSRSEIASLTELMLHSGQVLDFSDLPAPKVDKHSTGGVGDKTSLVLAPLVAAGGLYVPMISGRGLEHSGGTVDKLESIPGFNVNLSLADLRRVLKECGCAMVGQTAEVAPADKRIYALRDVTATVESPGLICGSIMSKKLAEGIDGLVLDVKVGSGAFMKTEADAAGLAELLVETGRRMGKRVVALLTDMDQPLGRAAGNAMEVAEALEVLHGTGPEDLRRLCLELAAWMFVVGGLAKDAAEGSQLAQAAIASGRALERFRRLVELQGGDPKIADDVTRLPQARQVADVLSPLSGYLSSFHCERVGMATVVLGAGRLTKEDTIDPAVGLIVHKKVGEHVAEGEPLFTLHYNDPSRRAQAEELLAQSFEIADEAPAPSRLVRRIIGEEALQENTWSA